MDGTFVADEIAKHPMLSQNRLDSQAFPKIAQMSGEDISNALIIEIFAGTSRVTACLRQIGLRSCFGVDHVKVKNYQIQCQSQT